MGASEFELRQLATQVSAGAGFFQYTSSRNGKKRRITIVTNEALRNVHARILVLLAPVAEDLPPHTHAFIRGRSIRSNALDHVGAGFIQKFDLADFFRQVSREKVLGGLAHFGAVLEVAERLADLTTVDGSLPMGFMTSPMLANISLYEFDADLVSLACERRLVVTRYADDIVFSSADEFDVAAEFVELASSHGLVLNTAKTRAARRGQRMVVTGLSIARGDRPRLPRAYRAGIRQELHYISQHGIEGHAEYLEEPVKYVAKRLGGRLAYAESVDAEWVRSIASKYPDAYKAVSRSGSPQSAKKRAASLRKLAARVRAMDAAQLQPYRASDEYGDAGEGA